MQDKEAEELADPDYDEIDKEHYIEGAGDA